MLLLLLSTGTLCRVMTCQRCFFESGGVIVHDCYQILGLDNAKIALAMHVANR